VQDVLHYLHATEHGIARYAGQICMTSGVSEPFDCQKEVSGLGVCLAKSQDSVVENEALAASLATPCYDVRLPDLEMIEQAFDGCAESVGGRTWIASNCGERAT
jgi:hypothetical protein